MHTTGYDNWKTENPYNESIDVEECENCQTESKELFQVGNLWVCESCKEEVEEMQEKVMELLSPILELKSNTLKRKLKTEHVANFLPKEMLLRWLKKELKENYHIEKDKVRIEELATEECTCVIEILNGLYQHNESLKNIKKAS